MNFYSYRKIYTTAIPLEIALRERTLLAYEFDGEPLDSDYGGPVRGFVPYLWGYKSAKSVVRVELIDHPLPGYWEVRGYPDRALILAGRMNGRQHPPLAHHPRRGSHRIHGLANPCQKLPKSKPSSGNLPHICVDGHYRYCSILGRNHRSPVAGELQGEGDRSQNRCHRRRGKFLRFSLHGGNTCWSTCA